MAHKIMTIVRQSGSGGAYIGAKVAEELGIPLYDHQLHEMAMKLGGLDKAEHADVFSKTPEEHRPSPVFYRTYKEGNANVTPKLSAEDTIYDLEKTLIRQIAEKEDAIIIGRCSNWVLRDSDCKLLPIYVMGSLEDKVARVVKYSDMDENAAERHIKKVDKQRDEFYYYVTKHDRNDLENYGLIINSGKFDDDAIVQMLVSFYKAV